MNDRARHSSHATTSHAATRQATRLDAITGRFDPWLIAIAIALASVGVVMVGSSSIAIGEGLEVGPFYFLIRHVLFLTIGAGLALWLARTELKSIEQRSHALLLLCFAMLLLVFMPVVGKSVNGAQRWINVPGVSAFQAVEAVKLMYIVWLASYLKRYSEEVSATWPAMLKPIGVAIALVILLALQPDFGSLSLVLAITAGMLVLGGVNMPRMFGPVLVGLPVLAVVAIAEPYRVRRLTSFLDPWADPFDSGYQLTNALMAVGRGEWFGVGLGGSIQKLQYLPEAHTDFILAVIAEEFGFFGVCVVIGLFVALVGRAFWIGLKCAQMRRHFSAYCAFGIALWMGLQSFVSVGVNLGLLPTKGLTLPMISYGGSSVLMSCLALGLLLRVSYELDRAQRQVARLRGDAQAPAVVEAEAVASPVAWPRPSAVAAQAPVVARPAAAGHETARGASRLRQRVEPTLGRLA